MKELHIFFIACFILSVRMMAQDGTTTPTKDWLAEEGTCRYGCSYVRSSNGTDNAVLYYSIKEKEEVEGTKYSKLFVDVVELSELEGGLHQMVFVDEECPGGPTCTDVLLIRENGGKVYCQTEDGTREWLIMDFSLKSGDTFVNPDGERFLVKETGMADNHRKLMLASEDGKQEDTWEERIGSLQWGFLPPSVVKSLKRFRDVDAPLHVRLWAAGAPYCFVSQNISDDFFILQSFEDVQAEDMTHEGLDHIETWLTFSFVDDSLHVQGYYPLVYPYTAFIAASITGTRIDISFHHVAALSMSMGGHVSKIDIHLPGFRKGTYEVGLFGKTHTTLECKGPALTEPVTFTAGQMATIILPSEPDAGKGKYYKLDRVEAGEIVFEQELQPRAHVPYIIVPFEDFSIDPGTLDLAGLKPDTVSVGSISFIGTYVRTELPALTGGDGEWRPFPPSLGGDGGGFYRIIDTTPDCSPLPAEGQGERLAFVGTLRAYLTWDDPYGPGATKGPEEEMKIVLHDRGTGSLSPAPSPEGEGRKDAAIYDLSGKMVNGKWLNGKSPHGIYIKDRKKWVKPFK